ncbi:MAG: sigma-70 family RNA polymerase sigma factor [Planctomycetes bacterium]|nr:sigma-70 family RNA polymerase sigma factor [Planctomycetota bacterium]
MRNLTATNWTTANDGDLLSSFIEHGRREAFEEIVRRHGTLVLGVCRSVLKNTHDAEDAAQAVFLALMHKAPTLQSRPTLVAWLHRAAWYSAAQAKKAMTARLRHEREAALMRHDRRQTREDDVPQDILYAGLSRLPEKYRIPVILHHLEGRSQEDVANLLGSKVSTITSHLNRGRQMLRDRLMKTGTAVSAAGLATAMANQAAAGVSPAFVASVTKMAVFMAAAKTVATGAASAEIVAISKGLLNMMFIAKMKVAAMVTMAVFLLAGAAAGTYVAVADGSKETVPVAQTGQYAGAIEVAVDCGKGHQIIRGLGTCLKSWDGPEKDPAAKWQIDPRGLDLYVKDGGFAVARIPLVPQVLEGENPDKLPAALAAGMMEDPAKILYDTFTWEISNFAGEKGLLPRGVRWFQELRKLNPDMLFIGSVWSPPHWMKERAPTWPGTQFELKGENSCGGRLAPKYYRHFAHYLAQWCLAMDRKFQIPLYAVSIQNEPLFVQNFASCAYTPQEYHDVIAEVSAAFRQLGVKTKIMGPEDMTKFPDRLWSYVKPVFADPGTKDALEIIASHIYSDSIEPGRQGGDCVKLRDLMKDTGREFWMTQTGGGPTDWQTKEGAARLDERGLATNALDYLGSSIHNAIVLGGASVWCTWQFMETIGGINDEGNGLVQASMAEIKPTKKYYIQKHYAAFIPPGTHRVETSRDAGGILAGAFANKENGILTLVLQNHNDAEAAVRIKISGGPAASSLSAYVTDKNRNCEKTADVPVKSGVIELRMPPRSLVTLTTKPESK